MHTVTNRIYLPDNHHVYVSDDCAGDDRLAELYKQHGNLKIEACYKDSGASLQELKPFWTGTIESFFN